MRNWIQACLLLVVALAIAACSTKNVVESDLGMKGAPSWVNEGTAMLKDNDGRLFHGVGSAPVMGDTSLQIATANDRARAEVARILSSYLDVASNDYLSSAGAGQSPETVQSVSRQIRNLTRVNLTGAKIIGHWREPKTNMVYAIAELDMQSVKETLQGVQEMNQDLKRYISEHGDNIFDRAATQETPK